MRYRGDPAITARLGPLVEVLPQRIEDRRKRLKLRRVDLLTKESNGGFFGLTPAGLTQLLGTGSSSPSIRRCRLKVLDGIARRLGEHVTYFMVRPEEYQIPDPRVAGGVVQVSGQVLALPDLPVGRRLPARRPKDTDAEAASRTEAENWSVLLGGLWVDWIDLRTWQLALCQGKIPAPSLEARDAFAEAMNGTFQAVIGPLYDREVDPSYDRVRRLVALFKEGARGWRDRLNPPPQEDQEPEERVDQHHLRSWVVPWATV